MPLESGIVIPGPTNTHDSHLQFIQDSLAYCENLPLLVISPRVLEIEEALNGLRKEDFEALNGALDAQREQRTKVFIALARTAEIRPVMERIEKAFYTSNYSYLGPLFRLLRDHHYYAWYETLVFFRALKTVREDEPTIVDFDLFADHRVQCAISKIGPQRFVISGPVVMESDNPTDGQFQRDVRASLARFNKDISRAFKYADQQQQSTQGGHDLGGRGPLYTTDYLSRHAFLRQKTHTDDLAHANKKIVELYINMGASKIFDSLYENLPVHMYSRLASAASALYDIAKVSSEKYSAEIGIKKIVAGSSSILTLNVDNLGHITASHNNASSNPPFLTYHVERSLDRTYTNWQAYNYESFDLVRNWLNNKFGYISQFSKSPPDSRVSVFSERLCRSLARLFRADECTIYRVKYQSESGELRRLGSFINRPNKTLRLELMMEHLLKIASSQTERKKSICYRALDQIRTKYCRFASDDAPEKGDFEASLAHPDHPDIVSWGVSGTAVPILVHGAPWGVIELISDHPHHFSNAVRAKIEDVASIMMPFLYFQSVFEALERAGNAASELTMSLDERKQRLLGQLLDIFMCKAAAIIMKEPSSGGAATSTLQRPVVDQFRLFGFHGEWWFPKKPVERMPLADLLPFGKIPLDDIHYYWACRIGGSQFSQVFKNASNEFIDTHRDDTLVVLRLFLPTDHGDRASQGEFMLAIVLRKEILVDLKLIELFVAFGTFLIAMLDSFHSHENWERVLRTRLGHELNKIWRTMDSTQQKFEFDLPKNLTFAGPAAEGLYWHLTADLKKHTRSVKIYSEILAGKRDNAAFRENAQVYVAMQRMQAERPARVSLRQVFRSAFMGRSADFRSKNILVDAFPLELDAWIESYEWLLLDVMQNLADNVFKYALAGGPLEISVQPGAMKGLNLVISNLAPALTDADIDRLFTEGGRGTYAISKKTPGQGIGLFLCRKLMQIAGYDLIHNQRPYERELTEDGYQVVWHDFTLVFPGSILLPQQKRVS